MKKIFKSLILGTLIILITSNCFAVEWLSNYNKAIEIAKKTNKPILMVVSSQYCGWCRKLEKDVLESPEFEEISKNFICLKQDLELNAKVLEKHYIRGVPMTFCFSITSDKVSKVGGYIEKIVYIEILQQYLNNLKD